MASRILTMPIDVCLSVNVNKTTITALYASLLIYVKRRCVALLYHEPRIFDE